MATLTRLPTGNWRAQVRRKGRYASATFQRKIDADMWAREAEREADRGERVRKPAEVKATTIAHLIDLHIADMADVGKPLRRSKAASLDLLRRKVGRVRIRDMDRDALVAFGRQRFKEGAGPVTIAADVSYLKTVMTDAAAVHGVRVDVEQLRLGRVALKRLGLIGSSRERDRRPTDSELRALVAYFEANTRQRIPMARIVRFAVATAMRQSEILRIAWPDVDERTRTVIVRDRKDPRRKDGNNQRVPLIDLTGLDAWALLHEQGQHWPNQSGRIFPYASNSVGAAFTRACQALGIEDLHFHDLRHEATSRLFEADLPLEKVALVTGHKDWKMLRRYTHLNAENAFAPRTANVGF
ncbi:site-specific integrase [Parvularcula oceani]|uniref:site-specific integrase n=1 Tax=Parvularcula oceani TaxID=1247963 RepID=UPI00068EB543|nr:site-specific integrase [Parvularcula oceani]